MPGRIACRTNAGRGFVLVELVTVVVVVAVTAAIALAMSTGSRRRVWIAGSHENLHRFAAATTAYAADNADLYWGLSWKAGDHGGNYNFPDDLSAAAGQAVDILRRKAGRQDMNLIPGWFPHIMYSHLPLYEYLGEQFPPQWGVSPADKWRLAWAQNPAGFDKGEFLPMQPSPSSANKRWPYSSSYELAPAFYDKGEVGSRVSQAGAHNNFSIPGAADLGALRTADVAFPSQKAHLFEQNQRDFIASGVFFAVPDARIAVLFADGSASTRTTADANPGWQPNNPDSPDPTYIIYTPQNWEPPTSNGQPTETLIGALRWTREGIAGRDFGGPEVGPP